MLDKTFQLSASQKNLSHKPSDFENLRNLGREYGAIDLAFESKKYTGPQHLLELISHEILKDPSCETNSPGGYLAFKKCLADYQEEKTQTKYFPEHEIIINSGTANGLYCALRALTKPGDKILVLDPMEPSYLETFKICSLTPVPIPLHVPDSPTGLGNNRTWSLDWQELESLKFENCKAFLFNSPHIPTGKVFNEEECARIVHFIQKNKCIVLCDETYENDIFQEQGFYSLCSFTKIQNLCLRVSSFDKMFGNFSFSYGWTIGPQVLLDKIISVQKHISPPVPLAIQNALTTFFNSTNKIHQCAKMHSHNLNQKRNTLIATLSRAQFPVLPSQGTPFLNANYESWAPNATPIEFCQNLITSKKIMVLPLKSFYLRPPQYLPYIKFHFLTEMEILDAAKNLLL